MKVWPLMIQRNSMIPNYLIIPANSRWSIGSKDFDNPKVYGDTSITDGLVSIKSSIIWICQSCDMDLLVVKLVLLHRFLKLYITLGQPNQAEVLPRLRSYWMLLFLLLNWADCHGSKISSNLDFCQIFAPNGKTATWRPNLEDVHLFAPQTNFRKT